MLPSILIASVKKSQYRDLKFGGARLEHERALARSTTLYVGNLSFYTTEEQIYALFSMCGEIKRIVMGLDRVRRTPCGFCFVEYYDRKDAQACVHYINGARLDDRVIRVDWDAGFKEGRQYGRGKGGGQVRDEYRTDYDPSRGGYGKLAQQQQQQQQQQPQEQGGDNASEEKEDEVAVGQKRQAEHNDNEDDPPAKRQRTEEQGTASVTT